MEALRLVSEMTLVAWNANAHRATKSQFKCQMMHSAIRHDKCRGRKEEQTLHASKHDHCHISCSMAQLSYKEPTDLLKEVLFSFQPPFADLACTTSPEATSPEGTVST